MLTKKSGCLSAIRTILFAFLLVQGMDGYAQTAKDGPTPGEILKEAQALMRAQDYDGAIDSMFLYLDTVKDSTAPRVLMIAQDVRYKLASILISKNRKEDKEAAIGVLSDYVSKPLAKHMRKANKMLVACYFETEMYAECIPAVTNALYYNDNPVVVAKAVADSDDTFADDGGEKEEPDVAYTQEELVMLYFTMGESYFKLQKMEECIAPFTYVSQNTKNSQRKGYAIMQIINALIELDGFDRIIAWVPELYRTTARYDIRVNLALLSAAAALYEAGEYDSALPLYRMIMPRNELLEYQQKVLRKMRIDAGLPPDMDAEMSPEEMILFGVEDTTRSATEGADVSALTRTATQDGTEETKPPEIAELEGLIQALKGMPPYESHVDFQMAQLYKNENVQRYFEAVKFFDMVHEADPTSEIGERSIYESVAILVEYLKTGAAAEERGFKYLDANNKGMYPRLIAYLLTTYYQRLSDWQSIKKLYPYIHGFERSNEPLLVRYDTELYFMQGVGDLMLQKYTNAVNGFQFVVDEFPGTDQEANSLFWLGFSYLCLEQYQEAYECFERYTRDFAGLAPERSLLDEAYYQGGICLFGLDRLDEAKERFTYVIETFGTNSTVYPESSSMRGDILGSEGLLDEAVEDYNNAFNAATKAGQATYAIFQMCEIFKADDTTFGMDPIIKAVNLYLAKWGDQGADIAKALFWLGRAKIQQKRYEEAADNYLQAIIDYGSNLRQDGVDLMIPELVRLSSAFLTPEQRDAIKTRLGLSMETTDSPTLKLRLRVALAKFDNQEVELGMVLIKELPDLDNAPPPVLAAISEASFVLKDYSRAEELLWTFKNKFEDSDYMRSAYKLRASGQFAGEDYKGALLTIADAQAEYGTDRDVAWAQLMKAQILLLQYQMYKSDVPMTQENLVEGVSTQLLVEQGRLTALKAQLAEAQSNLTEAQSTSDEAQINSEEEAVKRLLADQLKLEEKMAALQRAEQGDLDGNEVRALLARCKIFDAREANLDIMGVPEWRGEPVAQAIFQMGQLEEQAGDLLKAHGYYQRTYFQYKGHANGYWAAEGYLASARCLQKMADALAGEEKQSMENNVRNTYRAMLFDRYTNKLPQAEIAREKLGAAEVAEIQASIDAGTLPNISVSVIAEEPAAGTDGTGKDEASGAGGETSGASEAVDTTAREGDA